jgi:hypothetical protein
MRKNIEKSQFMNTRTLKVCARAAVVSARICEKLYYYAIYWKTGVETEYS